MTLKELYSDINGDYDDMYSRLNNEELMKKIVKMFASDTSYNDLKAGLEANDPELAFRGAHTLKGVALNLAFKELATSASELTEMLRPRVIPDDYKDLFDKVTKEYNKTIEEIGKLD